MTKVKVIGAGSIGNHLSNAARKLGWQVTIVDVDSAALARTKESLYPDRYGAWDDAIELCPATEAPKGGFDYIFVGTPPDSHMALALEALDEKPRAILVEKPVCPPDLDGAQNLWERSRSENVPVFVGYDHVVGMASRGVEEVVASGSLGPIDTLEKFFIVLFRTGYAEVDSTSTSGMADKLSFQGSRLVSVPASTRSLGMPV